MMVEEYLTMMGLGALGGAVVALVIIFLVLMIAAYVYVALTLMTIGKKLNVQPTWLAWIPIANAFYVPMLAGYQWYYGFLWLLIYIPTVGWIASIGLTIWWFWKISEARGKEGWLGILMALPLVNFVILGILAWSDSKNKVSKPKSKAKKK